MSEEETNTPDLVELEAERKKVVVGLLAALGISVLLIGFFHVLQWVFK